LQGYRGCHRFWRVYEQGHSLFIFFFVAEKMRMAGCAIGSLSFGVQE
jgi:hypothetical protein